MVVLAGEKCTTTRCKCKCKYVLLHTAASGEKEKKGGLGIFPSYILFEISYFCFWILYIKQKCMDMYIKCEISSWNMRYMQVYEIWRRCIQCLTCWKYLHIRYTLISQDILCWSPSQGRKRDNRSRHNILVRDAAQFVFVHLYFCICVFVYLY